MAEVCDEGRSMTIRAKWHGSLGFGRDGEETVFEEVELFRNG